MSVSNLSLQRDDPKLRATLKHVQLVPKQFTNDEGDTPDDYMETAIEKSMDRTAGGPDDYLETCGSLGELEITWKLTFVCRADINTVH